MANNTNLSFPSAFYQQFIDKNGKPIAGGKLYTYIAGSSTSAETYKTIGGGTESANRNTNPIILDMSGMAKLVISTDTAYKFILFDKNNVKIDEWDNVTAGGSAGGSSNVYVEGTNGEIDVQEENEGRIRRFIVSLSDSVKNAISDLSSSVNNIINALSNKKDKQQAKSYTGSATKTITGLSQNANGEMTATFSDIDFESNVLSFYPQSLGYMTPDERAALNAKMQEVAYNNGGMIVMWDGRNANLPCILSYYNSSEYIFYRIEKSGNKIIYNESIVTYDSDTKTFNVDQSLTTIDPALYEKVANKKTTITGNETSTTYYPNMKAVVDYINGVMQNLGGKLITDNGSPFSDSTDLPSSTPYNGVTIQDNDYAYVQGTGTAERWSASVNGSSVSWVNEYTINIPVFSVAQQAAIDSGITAAILSELQNGVDSIPTKTSQLTNDSSFATTGALNTGLATKQDVIQNLSTIESNAEAGATALQPNGDGSNVTATFSVASSRTNISSGENLSTIFGKIAKWFADLKSVAFSGSYADLTNKPNINNGTLTIKQNGTSVGTFSANQSGNTEINVTDTTYSSKSAASGGTDLSLVTTGEKYTWNNKQNAIGDLAEIRSGASAGASALQPSGNGSNVTATFSAANQRNNISSGEKLSTIFGKIAKWFSDLKAVAFSGNYADLSGTPTIPEAATATPQPVSSSAGSAGSSDYFAKGDHVHIIVVGEGVNNGQVSIAGKSVSVKGWNTKQNALPVGTTPIDTYSINISGTAGRANNATNDSQGYNIYQTYMRTSSGTKSLSFGSTTTIGSVNGSNVVLSMPQANFISKDLDVAGAPFPYSVGQFVALEAVPGGGTWHLYNASDVCDSFKTQIALALGINTTYYYGMANKAEHDANGHSIIDKYATKQELSDAATGLGNSLSSAVNGIYDSMNKGCVRSAFDYESIAGKFTDVFFVKRESTSYVDAVVRLKVWGKYQYISANNDNTFCADITVQIRGESGSSNWTSAIADGCILYKGSTSSVSDLRVKMTTDSDNRLYISILAANATEQYTRMIVESNFMTNNAERCTFRNLVTIYGSVPAGRSAIGAEFSLT